MSGTTVVTTLTGQAIQEAIDAASAGDLIFLQPGVFEISASVRLKPHVALQGAGSGTTILRLNPGANCHVVLSDEPVGAANISIRGLLIDGHRRAQFRDISNSTPFFACGVYLHNAVSVELADVGVRDVLQNAVHLDVCSSVIIDRCQIALSGESGIWALKNHELVVRDSSIDDAGRELMRSAIHIDGGSRISLHGGNTRSSGHGVALTSESAELRSVIVDCIATHARQGLAINGSHDHALDGVLVQGTFSKNRESGVRISNATHVFMSNCVVEDNAETGVLLQGKAGARQCVIAGCRISGNRQAIVERDGSGENHIVGNVIFGQHGQLADRGTVPIGLDAAEWGEFSDRFEGQCVVCGADAIFEHHGPVIREGYPCSSCGATLRYQAQAAAILEVFPGSASIAELVQNEAFRRLSIYEPGVIGWFRFYFQTLEHYQQSAYWPDVERGSVRDGLRCENLMALTFDDDTFDLVVTSDIFEHIRRPYEGFAEVRRVLKPGGTHVFSIPVLDPMPAKSVDRVDTSGADDVFLAPPQYHGPTNREHLVYTDFGQDMLDRLNVEGFETRAVRFDRGTASTKRLLTFISVKAARSRD